MTVNPYSGNRNQYLWTMPGGQGPNGSGYDDPTPYGYGQNWAAQQLFGMGWQPGMAKPTVPYQSDQTFNTLSTPDTVGTPTAIDQGFVDSLFNAYTQTHDPAAQAKAGAYTKSMGGGNYGGVITPNNPNAPTDPWGILNQAGIYKPGPPNSIYSPPADPWVPGQPDGGAGQFNTFFGQNYGTGAWAPGNGPGGWNQSNQTTNFVPGGWTQSGPWGTWGSGGTGGASATPWGPASNGSWYG